MNMPNMPLEGDIPKVSRGVTPESAIALARLAEEILGERLLGHVAEAGPVRHGPP